MPPAKTAGVVTEHNRGKEMLSAKGVLIHIK